MVTLTSRADIEAALADPRLVPVPVPVPVPKPAPVPKPFPVHTESVPVDPESAEAGSEGTMAWLRATVARFAHGEVHARRRAFVEAELARIDVAALRRLAAGTLGDDRTRVLRALADAMGLAALDDAAVEALCSVADNYFGGEDPTADKAVRLLLPLMQTDDPEQAANRIGILIQACDATAALIAATRDGSGDVRSTLREVPPVQVMRRIAIAALEVGTIEIPEGETVILEVGPVGLTFGHGPRVCPGRALAVALAEGAVEAAVSP